MIDLRLTEDHDLAVIDGDLALVSDSNQVAQHVKVRVLIFHGEWFADISAGIKYREEVFVKGPDMSVVDGMFKATILDTPGVAELTSYSSAFDEANRQLTVTAEYRDVFGNYVTLEEVLP